MTYTAAAIAAIAAGVTAAALTGSPGISSVLCVSVWIILAANVR